MKLKLVWVVCAVRNRTIIHKKSSIYVCGIVHVPCVLFLLRLFESLLILRMPALSNSRLKHRCM